MKKLTLTFWLALAAAGVFMSQSSTAFSKQVSFEDPIPTCPPLCPDQKASAQ